MARGLGILGATPQQGLFDDDVKFETQDHAIGGRMITVQHEFDEVERTMMDNETWRMNIRRKLANQLALAMLEQSLMETTSWTDPFTGRQTVAARCYLAPHDQVKILRVMHKR